MHICCFLMLHALFRSVCLFVCMFVQHTVLYKGHTSLTKKFLSADKYSMNCNKHPKILGSSLYTPSAFMAPSQNIMMSRNLLRTTNFLFLAVSGASLLLTLTLLHCWHVSVNWMSSACLDFMHKQWDAFFPCNNSALSCIRFVIILSFYPCTVTFHLFLPYFFFFSPPLFFWATVHPHYGLYMILLPLKPADFRASPRQEKCLLPI